MSTLSRTARETIKYAGVTVTAYASQFWLDGKWHGDACGCPDDRCAGHHHDEHEECGCIASLLADMPQKTK